MKKTLRNISSLVQSSHIEKQNVFKPKHLKISKDFKSLKNSVSNYLNEKKSSLYSEIVGNNSVNPYPMVVSQQELNEYRRIQEAIYFSIKCIVTNYDSDSRIRETYNFPDEVKDLLKLCDDQSYNVGSYRPDFLYESGKHDVKICEINSRFTLNAYLMTYFGYNLINECSELKELIKKNTDLDLECIEEINLVDRIYGQVFDLNKPIGILKFKEHGNDLYFFKQKYPTTILINPSDLIYDSGAKSIKYRNEQEITQFILELHQDEILEMPKDILKTIVTKCKYFNDLRTIFIGHDKRLLTILSRDDILSDYLSPECHKIIQKHRIYSVLPQYLMEKENSSLYENISINKNDWLIKPCLLGKGKGIIFGKDLKSNEWKNLLEKTIFENQNHFIFQKYLNQEKFSYFDMKENQQNIVGTLLCFNDLFCGPGIYRTSLSDLIALSRNGSLIFPVQNKTEFNLSDQIQVDELVSDSSQSANVQPMCFINEMPEFKNHESFKVPQNSVFHLQKKSFKDVQLYESSLISNGIAIISMNFEDSSSNFMFDLVKQLGIPQSHSSKGNDYLWDIRVVQNNDEIKTNARSHNDSEFLMHTDASFEKNSNIPRFFGLHVLKNDEKRGGQSLFIEIDNLLNYLTENEIKLLCNQKLEFRIPNEFIKEKTIFSNTGSILSFDKLNSAICRYRRDIINSDRTDDKFKNLLNKFESLVDIKTSKLIKYCQIKSNTIILVDNCRYLHGRTEIKDCNRRLRRIRFQTKHKQLLPNF